MTKKQALTLSITEIKALELRCNKCAGFVSLPLGHAVAAFIKCPGCGETLIDNGDRHNVISKLYSSLGQWTRFQDLPLDLTFTVDLPFDGKVTQ
jgi:Zn finger protein HypA/HybF involved in hydrogenase expression